MQMAMREFRVKLDCQQQKVTTSK